MSVHGPISRTPTSAPVGHQFSPYTFNGGSILAIAGKDFAVVAGDTRQSEGYSIQTRLKPKVFRLTDKATLACNGFAADSEAMVRRIKQRLEVSDPCPALAITSCSPGFALPRAGSLTFSPPSHHLRSGTVTHMTAQCLFTLLPK